MKKYLFILLACLCGCNSNTDYSDTLSEASTDDTYNNFNESSEYIAAQPCNLNSTHSVEVDGQIFVFHVPALCNTHPNLHEGDPPDLLNPKEETNPNDRNAPPGSKSSATNHRK